MVDKNDRDKISGGSPPNTQVEKALGLLSLAADKTQSETIEKGEECLESEVLAALIDNRCSPEEVTRIKEHLSECQVCYEQWLTLSAFKMGSLRQSKVVPLRRRRIYTFVGSTMALAASVAVFLNIVDYDIISQQNVAEEQTLGRMADPGEQVKKYSVRQKILQQMETPSKAMEVASPPQPAPMPESFTTAENGVSQPVLDEEKYSSPAKKEKEIVKSVAGSRSAQVVAKSSATQSFRSAAASGEADLSAVAGKEEQGAADFSHWRQQVTDFCRAPGQQLEKLPEILKEGVVLNSSASSLAGTMRETLPQLLSSLVQVNEENGEELCRQILAMLAQGEKRK